MSKPIVSTFEDVVRAIGKKDSEDKWAVIFKMHASFYSIDKSLESDVDLLKESKNSRTPVKIEYDAKSMEILKVT